MRALAYGYLGPVVLTACSGIAAGQAVTLSVCVRQETGGGSVVVPIKMVSLGGAQPTDLQWSLSYSSDVTGVAFVIGTEVANVGKSLMCSGNTCLR